MVYSFSMEQELTKRKPTKINRTLFISPRINLIPT
jgi:hypothetical protein